MSGIIKYGGTWERVEQEVFRVTYKLESCSTCRGWTPLLQRGQATAMIKANPKRLLFEGKTFVPVQWMPIPKGTS